MIFLICLIGFLLFFSTITNTKDKSVNEGLNKTIYYFDDMGNKYEILNFSGTSTTSLVAITECKTSFVLRNTMDKSVSLKISYLITHIKDRQPETLQKSLDLTLSPYENYLVSDTINYFAPGQSCSVEQDSIEIIYKSNSTSELNKETSPQKTVSLEEELINFCNLQFSNVGIFNLKSIGYLEDFSSASSWIENNYENSALTQEQKEHNINYIIENQLPKQGYPLVITFASKKDGQITSQGFYYCNENGVI